eukprot:TRINITY_DN2487_c0_g1_i2.p1 TRINITY_DN2487_c0_g1~~TRINITY_DN2487_c0_g1_i2.p1  ORF type:complete len:1172 (+),score=197.57 TRINITY_DN2487_c0_g1_i2:103-3618(+)
MIILKLIALLFLVVAVGAQSIYSIVGSGTCSSSGNHSIYDEYSCIRGAGEMKFSASRPIKFVNEAGFPHGCLVHPVGKDAVMNVNPGSGVCGGTYLCICSMRPPTICSPRDQCYHMKFDGPEIGDSILANYFKSDTGITITTDVGVHGNAMRVDPNKLYHTEQGMNVPVPFWTPPTAIWTGVNVITISAWIKMESAGTADPQYIVQISETTKNPLAGMSLEGGKPTCFATSCTVSATGSVAIGDWTFVTCAFDFGTGVASIYVGDHNIGLPVAAAATSAATCTFTLTNQQLWFGGYQKTPFDVENVFNGLIDDVRVFRKLVGADKIRSLACCNGKYVPLTTMSANGVCPPCDVSYTVTETQTLMPPPTETNTLTKTVALPTPTRSLTDTILIPPPTPTKTATFTIQPPDSPTETIMQPPTATPTIMQPPTATPTIMQPPTVTPTIMQPPTATETVIQQPTITPTLAEDLSTTETVVVQQSNTLTVMSEQSPTSTLMQPTPTPVVSLTETLKIPPSLTPTAAVIPTVSPSATATRIITPTESLVPPVVTITAVCEKTIDADTLAQDGILTCTVTCSEGGKFRSDILDHLEWEADDTIDKGFSWAMQAHSGSFMSASLIDERSLEFSLGPLDEYWPSGNEEVTIYFNDKILSSSAEIVGDTEVSFTINKRSPIPKPDKVTEIAKTIAIAPGAAKSAMLLGLNCKQRGNGTVEELMDWTMHPIGEPIGGSVHVGALVFNGLLTLSFVAAHALIAAVVYFTCSPTITDDPTVSKWTMAMGAARFPSLIFLPASFLFQGNAFAAIKLIAVAEGPGQVFAGGCGLLLLIGFLGFVVYLTHGDRFKATYVPDEHPPERCTYLYKLFYGLGTWASTGDCFVERWGEIFDCWKPRFKWFMVLELGHMLPLTAFAVRNMDSNDECGINAILMALVLFLYWCAVTFTFPFCTPFEAICMSLEALFQMVAMICLAVGFFSGEDRHPGFTVAGQFLEGAMWLMIIKTVYEVIRTLHDLCTGRTKKLKEAYEEDHKQLSETTDSLYHDIELTEHQSSAGRSLEGSSDPAKLEETQVFDDLYTFLDRADKLGVLTPTQNLSVGTPVTLAGIKNRSGWKGIITKQLEDGRVRVRLSDGAMLKVKPVNCTVDTGLSSSFAGTGDWNQIKQQAQHLQNTRSANINMEMI